MKKFFSVLLDDQTKEKTKLARNYFFACTLFYIGLQILLFVVCSDEYGTINLFDEWFGKLNFGYSYPGEFFRCCTRFLILFGANFTHASWGHVLGNMCGFFFCLVYIERKLGTFKTALLLLSMTAISSFHFFRGEGYVGGSSVVWYALFGYVIVDLLFSFRKENRNKTNIIFAIVVILLEMFIMSFEEYGDSVALKAFLWGFLSNIFHGIGILVGIFLTLTLKIAFILNSKRKASEPFLPEPESGKLTLQYIDTLNQYIQKHGRDESIERIEQMVIKSENLQDINYFANYVKDANIDALKQAEENIKNKKEISK